MTDMQPTELLYQYLKKEHHIKMAVLIVIAETYNHSFFLNWN